MEERPVLKGTLEGYGLVVIFCMLGSQLLTHDRILALISILLGVSV